MFVERPLAQCLSLFTAVMEIFVVNGVLRCNLTGTFILNAFRYCFASNLYFIISRGDVNVLLRIILLSKSWGP
jgi:hypothetical protein